MLKRHSLFRLKQNSLSTQFNFHVSDLMSNCSVSNRSLTPPRSLLTLRISCAIDQSQIEVSINASHFSLYNKCHCPSMYMKNRTFYRVYSTKTISESDAFFNTASTQLPLNFYQLEKRFCLNDIGHIFKVTSPLRFVLIILVFFKNCFGYC